MTKKEDLVVFVFFYMLFFMTLVKRELADSVETLLCNKGFFWKQDSSKQPKSLPGKYTASVNTNLPVVMQRFSKWRMSKYNGFFPFYLAINVVTPPHAKFLDIRRIQLLFNCSFWIKTGMNVEIVSSIQP